MNGKRILNPQKIQKIILLGATFSTNNMGVGALTAGTIKSILHLFPDAKIFLFDYGKEPLTYKQKINDQDVTIQLINIRFSKKVYLKNNIALLMLYSLILKLVPLRRVKAKMVAGNFYLRHISESDIIASIAGGDSFSDIYGLGRFFYVVLPQLLCLFMGKRLVLLPQTLGPFNGNIAKSIARYIMNRSNIIYSRDYQGIKEVQELLEFNINNNKLRFCYDVGFVVDPVKPETINIEGFPEKTKENSNLVGVNVSGLLFMGGYTKNNMFEFKLDYKELVYDLIKFIIETKNSRVLLVPHVFGSGKDSESDSLICEKLYDELKTKYEDKIYLVRGTYDQSQIKYIIGFCDFFIGSRMHACIAALSQNIPTVSIAYSKKFVGVMETIGIDSLVADPRYMDKTDILGIIDRAYSDKGLIRKQLEQKMPEVKRVVLNLFKEINELID